MIGGFFVCGNGRRLTSASTSSGFPSGRIGRDGSDVFNSADLQSISRQSSKSCLCTRARRALLDSARGAELDVDSSDAELLASDSNILRGKHGCVWRGLVAIRLDLHTACDAAESFTA